jgi:hypothetical protein
MPTSRVPFAPEPAERLRIGESGRVALFLDVRVISAQHLPQVSTLFFQSVPLVRLKDLCGRT